MKTIKFKQTYKKKEYTVFVEKLKDVFISVYNARYIFLLQLKNEHPLRHFYLTEGRPTEHDQREVLPYLKVKKIEQEQSESLFKEM